MYIFRQYIEIIFDVYRMMIHRRIIAFRRTIQTRQILEKWKWCMKKKMRIDGKVYQVQITKKLLFEHRSKSSIN